MKVRVTAQNDYLPTDITLFKAKEIIQTAVSTDRGEFIFTQFDYGDWTVRETKATTA